MCLAIVKHCFNGFELASIIAVNGEKYDLPTRATEIIESCFYKRRACKTSLV